jgi:polyisoprenoid-binding protein YceI
MSDTTQTSEAARVVDGRSVPAAGKWSVDPSHSTVEFVVRHLMVSKVRGRFSDYEVDLEIGERPEDSSVNVSIKAASISTGDEGRDGHLVSPDFLDVEQFPELTFRSTKVEADGDEWKVTGDLSIHGVTKPVVLEVEFNGVNEDPWGNTRAGFSAETEIDREEFGLTWNQPLAGGGVLVGKKVKIELDIEAVRG